MIICVCIFLPIVFYYCVKTRLSGLIGIFIAVFILLVWAVISHILEIVEGNNIARLFMLIIMYLGFKKKLNWFELTRKQKIERGMPVKHG